MLIQYGGLGSARPPGLENGKPGGTRNPGFDNFRSARVRQFPSPAQGAGRRASRLERAGAEGGETVWNRSSAGSSYAPEAERLRSSPALRGAVPVVFRSRGGTNLRNTPFISLFAYTKRPADNRWAVHFGAPEFFRGGMRLLTYFDL